MPSTRPISALYDWLTAPRQLTIFTGIAVALPTTYAFQSIVDAESGGFLLLVTLAVGVPTAYDEYWPPYDRVWKAVAWILAACVVATVEFVGLYLVGTDLLGLDPLSSSAGAFLITDVGNLALLAARRRRSES